MRRVNLQFKKNMKRFIAFSLASVLVISSEVPVWAGTANLTVSDNVGKASVADVLDEKLSEYLSASENMTVINGDDADGSFDALVRAVSATMKSQFVNAEVSAGGSSGDSGVTDAGDTTVDGDNVTGGQIVEDETGGVPSIHFTKDAFQFHAINNDKDYYDEDANYTFVDGKGEEHEYNGVYKGNIKADNNLELPMSDVGSVDNPYIVLEVTLNPIYSDIRTHIGDAGYFDFTQADLDKIVLTEDESQQVKINAIQYLLEKYSVGISNNNKIVLEKLKNIELPNALEKRKNEINKAIQSLKKELQPLIEKVDEQIALRNEFLEKKIADLVKEIDNTGYDGNETFQYNRQIAIAKALESRKGKISFDQYCGLPNLDKMNDEELVELVKNAFIEYYRRIDEGVYQGQEWKLGVGALQEILGIGWGYNSFNDDYAAINQAISDMEQDFIKLEVLKNALNDYNAYAEEVKKHYPEVLNYDTEIERIKATSPKFKVLDKLEAALIDYDSNKADIISDYPDVAKYDSEIARIEKKIEAISKGTRDLADELTNRGSMTIDAVIDDFMEYIAASEVISENELKTYVDKKLADALEYKRTYERAATNSKYYAQQYKFDLDWTREYVVTKDANGKASFVQYQGGETRKYSRPNEGNDYTGPAQYGEYQVRSLECYNPLAQISTAIYTGTDNTQHGIYTTDYPFRKACLGMAYKTTLAEDKTVESQDICYDEYIFAGWLVDKNGVLESIDNISDEELKGYTELYTSWMVRKYEQAEFTRLVPDKKSYIAVEFEGSTEGVQQYTVYLPNCIASCTNRNALYHDPRNQLTMCIPVSTHVVLRGQWGITNTWQKFEANYAEEISAWDFDFSKAEYNTVEKLKNVVPSLMADTDYYTITYNTVVSLDADGKTTVEYYPYNVQVLTMTPEELNKMVYYEYAQHTGDSAYYESDGSLKYHESERLNQFINNVDCIFFAGTSTYFTPFSVQNGKPGFYVNYFTYQRGGNEASDVIKKDRTDQFNPQRCPELCKIVDGEMVLDTDKVAEQLASAKKSMPDLEWQVVDKIYRRTGDTSQSRRIAVIINESFTDNIAGCVGESNGDTYGNHIPSEKGVGSKINWTKLLLMYFVFEDPTDMYEYYYLEDDANNPLFTELGVRFDKIKGVARDQEDAPFASSWFTGEVYGYDNWNPLLFYPFEILGIDHWQVMDGRYPNWQSEFGNETFLAYSGIAMNVSYKGIANAYAYTYNGDNNTGQALFQHNIAEAQRPTNNGNNTYQAFEYFRKVRPIEIQDGRGHPLDDGSGMIATKSAIEFMVQNAQNGVLNYEDKKITIVNEHLVKEPMQTATGVNFSVSRVEAEEVGAQTASIEYVFSGTIGEKSILVVEYYWTKTFQNFDVACNKVGKNVYPWYTSTIKDPDLKWYKMPESTTVIDPTIFKTYITSSDVPKTYNVAIDLPAPVLTQNDGTNREQVNRETSYYFNGLLKPQIQTNLVTGSSNPYYIIVVKEYSSMNAYLNNHAPVSVTTKNVIPIRLSLLFELD